MPSTIRLLCIYTVMIEMVGIHGKLIYLWSRTLNHYIEHFEGREV